MGNNESRSSKEFRPGVEKDASPAPTANHAPAKTNDAPVKKKPYRKPDFQFERVFETMALSCGKMPGHFRCSLNKKMS